MYWDGVPKLVLLVMASALLRDAEVAPLRLRVYLISK